MSKIKVTRKFDYRWPSGSLTAFPAGYEGTVKAEVLAHAIANKYGFDPTAKDADAPQS